MSKTNRNLQAKYRKACAQRVEASIAYRTLAPVAVPQDNAPKFRPAQTWDEAKPKTQWVEGTRTRYVPTPCAKRETPKAYDLCAPAGEVRLYRNGALVTC
jgi:hypothetical protein